MGEMHLYSSRRPLERICFYWRVEAQASNVINQGLSNRRTAETDMNRESSRSHCILMCTVRRKERIGPGMTKETSSRLNLVDLAGLCVSQLLHLHMNTVHLILHGLCMYPLYSEDI